jgi:hypothetical protein
MYKERLEIRIAHHFNRLSALVEEVKSAGMPPNEVTAVDCHHTIATATTTFISCHHHHHHHYHYHHHRHRHRRHHHYDHHHLGNNSTATTSASAIVIITIGALLQPPNLSQPPPSCRVVGIGVAFS